MYRFSSKLLLAFAAGIFSFSAHATESEEDQMFYVLGTVIYQNLEVLDLSEREADMVMQGLSDSLEGKAKEYDPATFGPKIQAMTQERIAAAQAREAEEGAEYVKQMAAEPGAVQTDSGLVYREIKAGTGEQPTAASRVKAHYHGTLRDGTVFDSSVDRGEPLEIGLNQVIPCWTQGIAMMKVGGKAKLTCPANLAYGPRGQGAIPPNSALTFDVELIAIVEPAPE